ncbi:MAG: hypothetical protein IJ403_03690 [Oscillospiraceae bacterium]|nr:hypothetical protein [Oscillospiraceae bacterium]
MAEKSYFRLQLDSTIRETEKLLKLLRTISESRDLETALQLSVTAAKISEGVALKTRALPAHAGHPQAERMVQEAISESVPVDIRLTEEGWFYLRMPILLPRKEKSPRTYLRGFLYPALAVFARERPPIRYRNCVMIFRHIYDRNRPEREYRDHDNIELNTVVDAVAMFFLVDDTPFECRHYYCSMIGDEESTEVFIVPRNEFGIWLSQEKNIRKPNNEKISEKIEKEP